MSTNQEEGSCHDPSCERHCRETMPLGGLAEAARSSSSGPSGMQHFALYCPQLSLQSQ